MNFFLNLLNFLRRFWRELRWQFRLRFPELFALLLFGRLLIALDYMQQHPYRAEAWAALSLIAVAVRWIPRIRNRWRLNYRS